MKPRSMISGLYPGNDQTLPERSDSSSPPPSPGNTWSGSPGTRVEGAMLVKHHTQGKFYMIACPEGSRTIRHSHRIAPGGGFLPDLIAGVGTGWGAAGVRT